MSDIFASFVKEDDDGSSIGTNGDHVLAGAVVGFDTIGNKVGDGNTAIFSASDGADYEVFRGTYTSSSDTLSRDSTFASSNDGNPVDWGSTVRTIALVMAAEERAPGNTFLLRGQLQVDQQVTFGGQLQVDQQVTFGDRVNVNGQDLDSVNKLNLNNNESSALEDNGDYVHDESDGLKFQAGGSQYVVWSSLNDGSGSGLNADLLDGNHASAFLGVNQKAADSDKLDGNDASAFVSVSGDAFQGNMNVNGFNLSNVDTLDVTGVGTLQIGTDNDVAGDTSGQGIFARRNFLNVKSDTDPHNMTLNSVGGADNFIDFQVDGSQEGEIDFGGGSINYKSFTGAHWSQVVDGDPDPPPFTVMATADELCEWRFLEYEAREFIEVPIKNRGTVRLNLNRTRVRRMPYLGDRAVGERCEANDPWYGQVTGTVCEDPNPNKVRCRVSDVAGDRKVYGVFIRRHPDGDVDVASIGLGRCRVKGPCTAGDLLESNGDGTARVQDDDLVRASTIGKVTIGNSDPDEKVVPVVLMCG